MLLNAYTSIDAMGIMVDNAQKVLNGQRYSSPQPVSDHFSSTLQFGRNKYFDAKSLHEIQAALNQSCYIKNLEWLLDPNTQFKVVSKDNQIVLKNYNGGPVRDFPPFSGTCNELTLTVGKYLEKKLGDSFVIRVANGTCDNYFKDGHFWLLIWPSSEDLRISSSLEMEPTKMPEGCLLVDPSLKLKKFDSRDYHLRRVFEFDQLSPDSLLPRKPMLNCPIGFLKDIYPADTKHYGEMALLYLSYIQFPDMKPQVVPSVTPNNDNKNSILYPDILEKLPESHTFVRFFHRVAEDLGLLKREC